MKTPILGGYVKGRAVLSRQARADATRKGEGTPLVSRNQRNWCWSWCPSYMSRENNKLLTIASKHRGW